MYYELDVYKYNFAINKHNCVNLTKSIELKVQFDTLKLIANIIKMCYNEYVAKQMVVQFAKLTSSFLATNTDESI